MPPPMSRYHFSRLRVSGSFPAIFQSRSSVAWVPLLSPRDTNGARARGNGLQGSELSLPPRTCAGSAAGPTMMKSFHAICRRRPPWPSSMNCCSASGSCTNNISASPRRAVSSALPVPCATTRTVIPLFAMNCGRMFVSRPELSTEVVEARTMDCAAAWTAMDGGKGGGQHQQEPVLDLDHVSSLPAVLALPASANTVALIEMLIPISTAPSASANDSSP